MRVQKAFMCMTGMRDAGVSLDSGFDLKQLDDQVNEFILKHANQDEEIERIFELSHSSESGVAQALILQVIIYTPKEVEE